MTTPRRRARPRPRRLPTALLVAGTLAVLTALSGCSSGDTTSATPEETLSAAKKNLDETPGLRIGLSTGKLPAGVSGLLKADGIATHAPAFDGDIKVATSGLTADAAVVAVDDVVWAKLPFTARFVPIDPADYGAPDPADLMNPDGGLSSLLTAAEDVQAGDQVREGKDVLSTFTGTVPGKAVAAVIPSASATADFPATFTVTDDDELSEAVLTGPFYPKADDVTYTITFEDYGTERDITKP
jgi:lipoprotein LprG